MGTVDNYILVTAGILVLLVVARIFFQKRISGGGADLEVQEKRGRDEPPPLKETVKSFAGQSGRKAEEAPPAPSAPVHIPEEGAPEESPKPGSEFFAQPRESRKVGEEGGVSGPLPRDAELSEEGIIATLTDFSAPFTQRIEAIKAAGMGKFNSAVPALIDILYEPDPNISAAAAESLGTIGDPRGIEPLLEITKRNDFKLMQEIPQELRALHPSPEDGENPPAPEDPGQDANPFKYKELTVFKIDLLPKEYFQQDGTPIPRKELVAKGLKDNDQQLRKMAAKAAIGMKDPEIVKPLMEALKNPFEVESVRFLAAEALGESGDETVGGALLEALKDTNVAVRYSAAAALGNFSGKTAVDALVKAMQDENEFVRSSAAYSLGQVGGPVALGVLFDSMKDGNEVVRFSIAKAVSAYDSGAVIPEVQKRWESAGRNEKLTLVEVLGQSKSEAGVGLLRTSLKDSDVEISYRASMALMGNENLEILDELIQASQRYDTELLAWLKVHGKSGIKLEGSVARAAKGGAGFMGTPGHDAGGRRGGASSESLENLAKNLRDPSSNVRGSAANNLGEWDTPVALEILTPALKDDDQFVRATVVTALGKLAKKLGNEAVFDLLKPLVGDPSDEVRYSLAKALGAFPRNAFAISILYQIVEKDPARDVRRVAKGILQECLNEKQKEPTPGGPGGPGAGS